MPEFPRSRRMALFVCSLVLALGPLHAAAQAAPVPGTGEGGAQQRAFDFEIGNWKTHLRRLVRPLTGSTTWVEYDGTSVVRKVWDGRANLLELDVQGPAGRIEALSMRLYDAASGKWSLNFASVGSPSFGEPSVGTFSGGKGEFFNEETYNGKKILVRFVISGITADSAHFEQAFSGDGGKTWEVNWVATDTRSR
jgi:hypothetical protein